MEKKIFNLLDSRDQVLIRILRIISKENRWYSLLEISQEVGLSDRSIQRYINNLSLIILDYNKSNSEDFSLLFKKHRGVKIIISKQANINFLISHIFKRNETIILFIDLLFNRYESNHEYMIKKNVSQYFINHAFDDIQSLLSGLNLNIDKKKFNIIGEEISIRECIYEACKIIFYGDIWPECFFLLNEDSIRLDIEYIIDNLRLNMTNLAKINDLSTRLSILIIRYRKKYPIKIASQFKKYVPRHKYLSNVPNLYDIIEQVLYRHKIFDSNETYFFILILLTNDILYRSESIKKYLFEYHRKIETDILKATDTFFKIFQNDVSEIPQISLEDSYEFIFRSHLSAAIYPQYYKDHNFYNFEDVYSEYFTYVVVVKNIIDKMKIELQFNFFSKERYLIDRYIMLIFSLGLNSNFKKSVKIKIDTNFSDIYVNYIQKYIMNYFSYKYNIIFIDDSSYQKYDLLLSNYPKFGDDYDLNIEYPFDEREIENIKSALEKLDNNQFSIN
ncbi:helix-turn-helix domain-containing protein [Enterococcus hermanniensis]|uniref:helix-turn-helix domain-containing protein n=1 Tax=Enterococcus hermanniensis TaxID=249189 RepID=UPI0008FFF6C2|nr:helix-turn-helix domain-containing protein [Enterococcus hermanniensis]